MRLLPPSGRRALRPSLAPLGVALLVGCPQATLTLGDSGKAGDDDTITDVIDADTDVDADTDADSDADTDTAAPDTGYATLYFMGGLTATAESFGEESWFGWGFYGLLDEETVCYAVGRMVEDGPVTHECPQCDWAFTLSGPRDMVEDGPRCDGFAFSLTMFEDYLVGWEWGFADEYALPYADQVIYLDETVLLYQEGYGFWPIAYNYGGAGRVTTDGAYVTFYGASGSAYYYYYR
jgi:hypothetical protein